MQIIKKEEGIINVSQLKKKSPNLKLRLPKDPEAVDVLKQIRSIRIFLNSLESKVCGLGKDRIIDAKEIVEKLSMVIFNNTPLKEIDSTPDAGVTSFGTKIKM
jgi:hypothetical protein